MINRLIVVIMIFAACPSFGDWDTNEWSGWYWRTNAKTQLRLGLEERFYGSGRLRQDWNNTYLTNLSENYSFNTRKWWVWFDKALGIEGTGVALCVSYIPTSQLDTNGVLNAITNLDAYSWNEVMEEIGATNVTSGGQYYFDNYRTNGQLRWWGINRARDYEQRKVFLDKLSVGFRPVLTGGTDPNSPFQWTSAGFCLSNSPYSSSYYVRQFSGATTSSLSVAQSTACTEFSTNTAVTCPVAVDPAYWNVNVGTSFKLFASGNYVANMYRRSAYAWVEPRGRTNVPNSVATWYVIPKKPEPFDGNWLTEYDAQGFGWTENEYTPYYTNNVGTATTTSRVWSAYVLVPDATNCLANWYSGSIVTGKTHAAGMQFLIGEVVFDYRNTNAFEYLTR